MDNAVYSSIDLRVKLWILNKDVSISLNLYDPSILATKINHEQKQDVPARL